MNFGSFVSTISRIRKTKKGSLSRTVNSGSHPEDEYINQGFTYSPEIASINTHPKTEQTWETKLKHCVPNFYQNSSSSHRSLVTPADFLQIFIFATRWHRGAMLSGSENGKMLKYAGVKYRSAEYITPLHLRPIGSGFVTHNTNKKDSLKRIINVKLSSLG